MLTDDEMRDRMKNGWRMGEPYTKCGNGSLPQNTKTIREWLPGILQKYDILTLADAGAGDMAWLDGDWVEYAPNELTVFNNTVSYTPYDLIPRLPFVNEWDITDRVLPKHDAILCRMVLNHLDEQRVLRALTNFMIGGATYLFATQFDGRLVTDVSPQFQRLDLTKTLGAPIEQCRDGSEPNCYLAMWQINP